MIEALFTRLPYVCTVVLMGIGLYGMLFKANLLKKLIGLNILQAGIILFFIVQAYKIGATVPIVDATFGAQAAAYVNPIPHGLMLTAIVVSVATTGVALALLVRIYGTFATLDEDELLASMRRLR